MRIDLGWKEFTPDWGDGSIVFMVKPFSREALQKVAPLLQEEGESTIVRMLAMQELAEDVFGGHVKIVRGFEDADGKPLPLDALWTEGALAALTLELFMGVMALSQFGDGDAKNSEGPVATAST